MGTTTRLPALKRLIAKAGFTRAKVAEELEVPEATVADWERKITNASVLQIKDLAVLLDVPAELLFGQKCESNREASELYGSLKIRVPKHKLNYPISVDTRNRLIGHLDSFDFQNGDEFPEWFSFATLNNKLVYANPDFVHEIEFASDDEEEAAPYAHPEVYAALADWETEEEVGPLVKKRCDFLLEYVGEQVIKEAQYARLLTRTGKVRWHFLLEAEDTYGLWCLDLGSTSKLLPNRFLRTRSEGYHLARYVNLSSVAVIEVPTGRFNEIENKCAEIDDGVEALVKKVLAGSPESVSTGATDS